MLAHCRERPPQREDIGARAAGFGTLGPPHPKEVWGGNMGKCLVGAVGRVPLSLPKGRMIRAQKVTFQPEVTRIKSDRARV